MKNLIIKTSLIVLTILLFAISANAYDFEVDGLCYNYNEDSTSVTVTYANNFNPRYYYLTDHLIIPERVTYNGRIYNVTAIGERAFTMCYINEVTIPYSVKKIGYRAFYGCDRLTHVTIPNYLCDNSVFDNFSYCELLTSITVIGQGAWNLNYFGQLKNVNIGSGITSLGDLFLTPDVVNCYSDTPPSCSDYTFSSNYNYEGELHVPVTSISAYFLAEYWQNFNNWVNDLSKITLNTTSEDIVLWETLELNATVFPEDGELLWNSTDPSVATVNENGIVTAIGGGECDIYTTLATNPAIYAICHIDVSYPEITLSLSDEFLEMNIGDEQFLTVNLTPSNTGLIPIWESSDESIATVVNGVVHANNIGECDITATVLDHSATCHLVVKGDDNITITLNIDNAIIGTSQMLTVYPSCTPDVPVELVVTSSDPSVAVARVVNRTNAPAQGLQSFPEKDMALAMMEELAVPSESKAPAYASEKAIMIVGVQNGTATITVTTADGKATPAVLELRVVDVDGDRVITSGDITALYNYLLNGEDTFIATSDTDGDGYITSTDITVIYNLILGN